MPRTGSHYTRWMLGLAIASASLAIAVSFVERAGVTPAALRPIVVLVPVVPLVFFFFRIAG